MWTRTSFTSVSGHVCNMYVAEGGRGSVIFLHGWGDHGGRYHAIGELLHKQGFRVLIPEFPGHGLSSGPRARVNDFDVLKQDLHAIVAKQPQPVFLIGHSMGGCLAFHYAVEHPRQLAGVVFNSAALGVSPKIPSWKKWLTRALGTALPYTKLVNLKAAWMMTSLPGEQAAYDADTLLYHGKLELGTGLALMRANQWCSAHREEFTLPMLALQGREDELVDPVAAERLYEAQDHPASTLKLYDARHDLLHDYVAEDVTAQIVEWLERRVAVA